MRASCAGLRSTLGEILDTVLGIAPDERGSRESDAQKAKLASV